MSKLNVLILETAEKHYSDLLCIHYKTFFLSTGFEAEISCVSSQDDVINKLNTTFVDVFISDLSLKNKDFAGLIVVKSVKRNYPDVFCIGNSGKDIGYRDVAAKLPTFDMFIDKASLLGNNQDYIKDMKKEFLTKFKRNTDVEIDDKSVLPDKLTENNKTELNSLLSQVTFVSYTQDPDLDFKKILLTPISGGISGSHVFKMTATAKEGDISTIPAVLKISNRKNAEEELENYTRFVKWVLPYSWRADLLGSGFTHTFGALCHSFIMSGKEDIVALSYFMNNGEVDIVKRIFKKIFDPKNRKWYADELNQDGTNINERYLKRYYPNNTLKNKAAQNFSEYCQKIFPGTFVTRTNIKVFDQNYALPVDCLFGDPHGEYQTCVIHGDMNSNNVLVAHNQEIIFIDFQYTGRGHVFEDFITMEASIRLHFGTKLNEPEPKNEEWKEIFQQERYIDISSMKKNQSEMYKLIALLRSLARKNFPNENFQNYYYGVAAIYCRMLRLDGLTDGQIGYLLSGILASLEKLENSKLG